MDKTTDRTRRVLGAGIYLSAAVAACLALPSKAIDASSDEVARLRSTSTFALGLVGFIGHISEGEQRYRAVLQSADAQKIFREMLASSSLSVEAKLYAACGIRRLAPAEFRSLARTLRESGASASVLRTDILKKEPVAELLGRIERYGCEPPMPPME